MKIWRMDSDKIMDRKNSFSLSLLASPEADRPQQDILKKRWEQTVSFGSW